MYRIWGFIDYSKPGLYYVYTMKILFGCDNDCRYTQFYRQNRLLIQGVCRINFIWREVRTSKKMGVGGYPLENTSLDTFVIGCNLVDFLLFSHFFRLAFVFEGGGVPAYAPVLISLFLLISVLPLHLLVDFIFVIPSPFAFHQFSLRSLPWLLFLL